MIAKMTLTMGPRRVVAELADDFTWRCDDLLTQTYLNECHGPVPEQPSSETVAGGQQARKAAEAVESAGWSVDLCLVKLQQDAA